MAQSWQFPPNPSDFQTTVTPGSGSAGFTSNAVIIANTAGALDDSTFVSVRESASSGTLVIQSTNAAALSTLVTGALVIGPANRPRLALDTTNIQFISSAGVGAPMVLNSLGGSIFIGGSTSQSISFYGVAGQPQPSSYSTNASVGTTRANAVMNATTLSTASFTINLTSGAAQSPVAGPATTADARTLTDTIVKLVDDMKNVKQLLNSVINDLKAWGLSN